MIAASKVVFAYTQIFMTLSLSSWAVIFYALLMSVYRYLQTKAKAITYILRWATRSVWRQGFYRRKSIWILAKRNHNWLCWSYAILHQLRTISLLASSLQWVKFFCAVTPVAHEVAYTRAESVPVTTAKLCSLKTQTSAFSFSAGPYFRQGGKIFFLLFISLISFPVRISDTIYKQCVAVFFGTLTKCLHRKKEKHVALCLKD